MWGFNSWASLTGTAVRWINSSWATKNKTKDKILKQLLLELPLDKKIFYSFLSKKTNFGKFLFESESTSINFCKNIKILKKKKQKNRRLG